jgi:hypothetical protein
MTKTILVTLVLFHLGRAKTIKVFDTKMNSEVTNRLDGGRKTSEKRRAPFAGLQVILYLHAGTDLAQPIRVVRDSCVRVKPVKCLRIFYVILISNKSNARQWNVERTLKLVSFCS